MNTHSNLSYRTSQVNHAGDSTPQSTKQDTGVGSGVWLGHPVSLPYVVEGDCGTGSNWSLCFSAPLCDTPESHWVGVKSEDDAWKLWSLIRAIPTNRERANAGDSVPQIPKQDTGVGSDCWFGRFILREETALRTSRDCFRRRVQYQRGRPTHFLRLEARRLQQFWFDVRTETVIAAKCLVPALGILGFRLCLVKLLRAVKRVLSFCSWVSSFFRRTSKVSHG